MELKNRMIKYRDFHKLAKTRNKKMPHRDIYYPVLTLYMKYLVDNLLKYGKVKLPKGCGSIKITGRKLKIRYKDGRIIGALPDWAETKKLWERDTEAKKNKQLVYHFNEETNGILYSIKWDRFGTYLPNKFLYNFRASRNLSAKVAKEIMSGKEYYIQQLKSKYEKDCNEQ